MKILIVEVNWLGDVLFSTPAIKALRKKFPDSHIACLIVPRVKEVLALNPHINELIINDENGLHKGFLGKLKLAQELKQKKFDVVVLFHRSFTRAFLAYWAGIPQRVGYYTWKRSSLLTQPLPMPKKDSLHRVDYYLTIVKPLGADTSDRFYEFFTAEEDKKFIDNFFKDKGISAGDFVVCLNPGGNWFSKRWPKEHFAQLADRLITEYKVKAIFSGAKDDLPLIQEIAGLMKNKPIVAAGETTLKQSACLFKKANLVISADSGPLHIAAAEGANVIALFGPTSSRITGPMGRGRIKVIQAQGSDCTIPCYDTQCNNNRCMQAITVSEVVVAVQDFLKG